MKKYFLRQHPLRCKGFRWCSRRLFYFLALLFCSFSLSIGLPQLSQAIPSTGSVQTAANLVQQATSLYQAERFVEAEPLWQTAAELFAAEGDSLSQAMALSNRSLTAQQLGQWEVAQQAIAQSLSLLQSQSRNPAQPPILAATLDIQGQLHQATGQPNLALESWRNSATLYQTLKNPKAQLANQINQAQALQDLGLYPKACETLLQALGIGQLGCQISGSTLQTLPQDSAPALQSLGLQSLGNVLRIMGQPEQSWHVLQKSWQIAQPLNHPPTQASLSLSLGNTVRALGNKAASGRTLSNLVGQAPSGSLDCLAAPPSQPEKLYQQAIACYQAAERVPKVRAKAQLNRLSLLLETQQWSAIPNLLVQLQSSLAALPPSDSSIKAQLKLAQHLMCLQAVQIPPSPLTSSPLLQSCLSTRTGHTSAASIQPGTAPQWSEIQAIVASAATQAQSLKNPQAQAQILGYQGAIAQQMGDVALAQRLTEQALQTLSSFNNPELTYPWQWQLGRLYQQQGQTPQAIAAYTLAYETLQSLRRDLVAADLDLQFTFRDRVEPVYRELVDLLLQGDSPPPANLKRARDVIEALQLAELNNFFREACLTAQPQPIDRLDPKAAVLYGIVLPKRLAVIAALPGQPLRYYATPFPSTPAGNNNSSKAVEMAVDDLLETLNPYFASPNLLQPRQKLYDWLIRPIEADLQQHQIKTLVFVLDGALRSIPVAALHDGKAYLAERFGLALTPGLQLLKAQPSSMRQSRTLVAGLAAARQGFSSLPGVEREVQEVTEVVPSKVLLDSQFTRDRLQNMVAATRFSSIHLATHGQFSSKPEETFLLTWDERINVKNLDQFLLQGDRPNATPIELLILSACQTATGDKRATLGLAGVATRSGARSTLATLWSVQDQSTADFMAEFYRALQQPGIGKGEALRQAQISLMHSSQYRHPYYWAPFVLVGNWL